MIPVTEPFMPPIEEYEHFLKGIWETKRLTNNGPLLKQLEQKLKEYLGLKNLLYVSNGTIALQIAIKALELKDEVITTPFSYVATTSSLVWEGCEPVFVDINQKTLNINPDLIEDAITEKTSGIMATHIFGNSCDIESIQTIADKHGLKVIYDAAHCFGTTYKGKSVFEYGDISTTSFQATKLFHTIEGGALITKDHELNQQLIYMRNFGHTGPEPYLFNGVGINGKNSEYHAAMGLCNLLHIDEILDRRRKQCLMYDKLLIGFPVQNITIQKDSEWNYAYYPVIFESESRAITVKKALEQNDIYPRRYFYPSLDTLDYVKSEKVNVSRSISERILCLPLYFGLKDDEQELIIETIVGEL